MNTYLKYRRFDQVLDDIQVDFQAYSLESLIEPQQLIKVVKRVNYDLGLKINKTKEVLLEVCQGNVKLPDDFYVLNYALVCDEVTVNQSVPQGTWIEERPVTSPSYQTIPETIDLCEPPVVNACVKPELILNCKGETYELVQIVTTGVSRTYKRTFPIKMIQNPQMIDCECPNLYTNSHHSAWLRDGYLYSTLKDAIIYISYQGQLEDDEGNLLLPDHDMLNEYYEYAIKARILENLIMNDEPAQNKLQLVEARLRAARNQALGMVNTPDFGEMKKVWEMNRRAQYSKYFNMFKSY